LLIGTIPWQPSLRRLRWQLAIDRASARGRALAIDPELATHLLELWGR